MEFALVEDVERGRQRRAQHRHRERERDHGEAASAPQLRHRPARVRGRGHNVDLVRELSRQVPCQIGGGIRSVDAALATLKLGARRVILGSSLISEGAINTAFAQEAAAQIGSERLVFAVDSRGGRVAIRGWQEVTDITPLEMMRALEPFCSAFLYTHIDTEGLLKGIPFDVVSELRGATSRQLIAAGGIRNQAEVDDLDALGVDSVVGMAIYQGLMPA